MTVVTDLWNWIERQERDFVNRDVPFSDRQVKYLISQLRLVEPYLKKHHPNKELVEHFADKMELKFYKEDYTQRFLLFDFIKNFIHETLIRKGVE